jgi:hypothetical protein
MVDARYRRAEQEMSMVPIDQVIAQIIFEIGRLPVTADAACRPDIGAAVVRPLLELNRDAAVLDITDIAVVQRVEMRDVEQVLDQQQRVGRHRHRPCIGRFPRRIGDLRNARRPNRQRFGGLSRPNPDEAVLLYDRERPQPGFSRDVAVGMRRHPDALAGRVVAQAMIGAFEQTAFDEPALRQWHPFVAAALVERDDTALGSPPHYQRLFRDDLALQLLRGEFVRQPGHVPGILHQHISRHNPTLRDPVFHANLAASASTRQATHRIGGRRKAQKAMQPQI